MKLREALEQSPIKAAGNNNLAWGHASIVKCEQSEDGKIEVEVYMHGGEYQSHTFNTPEEVSLALYSQGAPGARDSATWDGPDTWYPRS
jgi:hypothetical protein